MSLIQAIQSWNGKNVVHLSNIYKDHCHDEPCILQLIAQLESSSTDTVAATWLIKHHLESNHGLNSEATGRLFQLLPDILQWQSQLHILQSLPYLTIAPSVKDQVAWFVREMLISEIKFVRAWAYNGLYELARHFPEYRKETNEFCEMAMRDEAPSVKARVRNIMKKGF